MAIFPAVLKAPRTLPKIPTSILATIYCSCTSDAISSAISQHAACCASNKVAAKRLDFELTGNGAKTFSYTRVQPCNQKRVFDVTSVGRMFVVLSSQYYARSSQNPWPLSPPRSRDMRSLGLPICNKRTAHAANRSRVPSTTVEHLNTSD